MPNELGLSSYSSQTKSSNIYDAGKNFGETFSEVVATNYEGREWYDGYRLDNGLIIGDVGNHSASPKMGYSWNPSLIKYENKHIEVSFFELRVGANWSLPGGVYQDRKRDWATIGIGAGAEANFATAAMKFPLGQLPLELSLGFQLGIGGTFDFGYTPGSKKLFGFSVSYGPGISGGLNLKD